MGRENWLLKKQSKNFNVHLFRHGLSALILFLVLSGLLSASIFHYYLKRPERDYYATSGITPPIKLVGMKKPNMTAQPMLAPDPPTDNVPRLIPQ